MERKQLGLALLFILLSWNVKAQMEKIDTALTTYNMLFPQEKIHIHFDKDAYSPGDTLWFKAYLLGNNGFPSDISRNFYADFYDATGQLLAHFTAPILESSAKGQLDIPHGLKGDFIHVRAYTRWMLNFDTSFLFEKDIYLINHNKPLHKTQQKGKDILTFFPEGGDMVAGLESKVAFLCTNNQWGKPVKVKGFIKNEKNQEIVSFHSIHDGMGYFLFTPQANEKYTAYWSDDDGNKHVTPLPATGSGNVVLKVTQEIPGVIDFTVKRKQESTQEDKLLNIVALFHEQEVYRSRANLSTTTSVSGEIHTDKFPTGIMRITLFNANWKPIAERVIFINNYAYNFDPEVRVLVKGLNKRMRNQIEIHIPDTITTNMSISVTDGGLYFDSTNNIISHLLLSSEIKGYINNPAYYFSGTADSLMQHLDLVMLTHGWRRFDWDHIVQEIYPSLKYPREHDYLELKGNVYGDEYLRQHDEKMITVFLERGAKGRNFFFLPINHDGAFSQPQPIFFDTLKIFYSLSGNTMFTSQSVVKFQNGLMPLPQFGLGIRNPFIPDDSSVLSRNMFFAAETERLLRLRAETTLKEVVVKSEVKNKEFDQLEKEYTSGLFTGGDGYQFDIMKDPVAQSSLNVFQYLQGRVAGLQINTTSDPPSLTWRSNKPDIYLDEMPSSIETIKDMPMTDIAYIKVFRPPFFGPSGGGAGGAISIYTRKGSENKSESDKGAGMEHTLVVGYSPDRQFYNPDYSVPEQYSLPDLRSTLYWNPYVITNKRNQTVWIEFYNNDISKRLRLVIEGMDNSGKLTRVDKLIQ